MTFRAILSGPARSVALTVLLAGMTAALGDTIRVKTGRGTFLVVVDAPDVAVRGDGDDLVVTRPGGEEIRLKPDAERADRSSADPILSVRRDGRVIVSARRVGSSLSAPVAAGPGRTILGQSRTASAWSLAITPDGRTLVSGHQGFLHVWDLATRAERFQVPTGKTVRRVAVTPDGLTIASVEYTNVAGKVTGNVLVRDGKTGEVRRVMKPVETGLHAVTIDPQGMVIVSSSWGEPNIHVWDARTGEQVGTLKGHSGVVGTVTYSPDGKTLASGGDDTVRLWDVDTGSVRQVFRGHRKSVESVAYAADGKTIASGGFDATARVWDAATGKLLATMETDQPVLSVALSPDGKAVASASARWGNGFYNQAPAEVQVWEVATGKPTAKLPEQPNQVFAMVFTPDGKSLITASLSGAVIVWDLAAYRMGGEIPN